MQDFKNKLLGKMYIGTEDNVMGRQFKKRDYENYNLFSSEYIILLFFMYFIILYN
jgi:hypothetical protein